jgi:AraC-like DNA-binding protein
VSTVCPKSATVEISCYIYPIEPLLKADSGMNKQRFARQSSKDARLSNCDQLADTYRLLPVTYAQAKPGELGARVVDRSTARTEVRLASYETDTLISVTSVFPRFAVGVGINGKSKMFGDILGSSNVGYLNGHNGVLAAVSGGAAWCNTSIDHALLQKAAEIHHFQIPVSDGSKSLPPEKRVSLAQSLSQLVRAQGEARCSDAQFEDQVVLLILHTLNPINKNDKSGPSLRSAAVKRAVEYIHTHFARDLTVTELCTVTGVSERTLQYAFGQIYDLSPQNYLKNYRLERARNLLQNGDANRVADAARACGIHHQQRFAQYFKAMYGESPSEVLKRPARMYHG